LEFSFESMRLATRKDQLEVSGGNYQTVVWQDAEYHPLYWHQNKTIILL